MRNKKIVLQDMYDTILFLVSVYSFEHIKAIAESFGNEGISLKEFADSLPKRNKDGVIVFNDWQKDVIVENFTALQDELLAKDLGTMASQIKMIVGVLNDMIMIESPINQTIH